MHTRKRRNNSKGVGAKKNESMSMQEKAMMMQDNDINGKTFNQEESNRTPTTQQNQNKQGHQSHHQQRIKSVIYMTLAMSIHFAGHEFARSPIMSMFTSSEMGFQSHAILPLAVGCVSPFSVVLLLFYARNLKLRSKGGRILRGGGVRVRGERGRVVGGPNYALMKSTLIGSMLMFSIGCTLYVIKILQEQEQLAEHHQQQQQQFNVFKKVVNFVTFHSHKNKNNIINSNNNNNDIILPFSSSITMKHLSKTLLFIAFVFQSANVQFLYTQHWSFIGSVLSPRQIASSGTLIAGIGSISSTIAAAMVKNMVNWIGLIGTHCLAAVMIGSSAFFANEAYQIAMRFGFEPHKDLKSNGDSSSTSNGSSNGNSKVHHYNDNDDNDNDNNNDDNDNDNDEHAHKNIQNNKVLHQNTKSHESNYKNDGGIDGQGSIHINDKSNNTTTSPSSYSSSPCINSSSCSSNKDDNMFRSSIKLFQRVPILSAMFCEVIIAQCLSSLLNFQFVTEIKNSIENDEDRAGFTGNCYAYVNGISGALQFFILPFMVKRIGATWLWLSMPLIMLILTSLQYYEQNPSLTLVGLTFLTMKTIEYSLRGQASEMIWCLLDYESRFMGKELINLFANRLGKSTTAISLFLFTVHLEKDTLHLRRLTVNASILLAFLWLLSTFRVTRFIPREA